MYEEDLSSVLLFLMYNDRTSVVQLYACCELSHVASTRHYRCDKHDSEGDFCHWEEKNIWTLMGYDYLEHEREQNRNFLSKEMKKGWKLNLFY